MPWTDKDVRMRATQIVVAALIVGSGMVYAHEPKVRCTELTPLDLGNFIREVIQTRIDFARD